MNFVGLDRQGQQLHAAIQDRIAAVLRHGEFILGPEVGELEQQLATHVGVQNAIGVANGTDAITLALMALGIGSKDAVFLPAFTFIATAEPVALIGATPVFVDVEEATYNLDPDALDRAITEVRSRGTSRPRCIIAVDLFGLPANYSQIAKIAEDHGLMVVEDAAQSFGGAIGSRRAGSFAHVATTSFFPAKPLGCYGDGGAVFTDDDSVADLIRSLRVHGKGAHKYENVRIGLNSRLDTIQAAILLEKLTAFEEEVDRRREIASYYSAHLSSDFAVPAIPVGYESAWAQYTVRGIRHDRDYYLSKLKANGVPAAVYYPKPLHLQKAFAHLGYVPGDFPIAEKLSQEVFSLPIHPYLTRDELEKVVAVLVE